jgi:hypothetical protein
MSAAIASRIAEHVALMSNFSADNKENATARGLKKVTDGM